MRFASLGSGSQGNALVVEAGKTRILLDCGFGINDTITRLGRLNLGPEQLDGIIITHEHDDHIGGVAKFAAKFRLPVWLTQGTFRSIEATLSSGNQVSVVDNHTPFSIGDIQVCPFPVPHDAEEPVQYVLCDGDKKLGVLTDTGCITSHIQSMLHACSALVLECNHDLEMLHNSSYPQALKRRIAGRLGHLDNKSSAQLLVEIDCTRLQHVIAAHLSKQNNTPELVRTALSSALGCEPEWVGIADQEKGLEWRTTR